MCKPIKWIATLTILLLVLTVTPAAAASVPLDVGIVVTTYFLPTGNTGPFIASGPAVDAGVICPTGTATDIYNRGSGGQSGRGANYLVLKEFTCDDRSGTFILKLEARVDWRGDIAFWNVFSGTGKYVKLLGAGKDFGEFFFDSSGNIIIGVFDHIFGKLQ